MSLKENEKAQILGYKEKPDFLRIFSFYPQFIWKPVFKIKIFIAFSFVLKYTGGIIH